MNFGLAFALWLIAAVVAVGNGYIGNIYVSSRLGEYGAHVYKTVVLVMVLFFLAWFYARRTQGPGWAGAAWGAGFFWLGLTVIFEFIAGHYVFGNPWNKLFADYRLWAGRLWILVLLAELFGPPLMGWVINR